MRRLAFGLVTTIALVAAAAAAEERAPRPASKPADALAEFFGRTKGMTRVVPASEVWERLHAGTNPYFVVDVRPAPDYAKGHVPGAISLPIDVLFRPESLARLPGRERPLLLVCQSGHSESMALGGLVALGYEPWVMRFGMIGWSAETKVKAGSPAQEPDTVRGVGGPVEK